MINAIVLAAGRSKRMGTQKLLLPFRGKPLIAHIVDCVLASKADKTLVVISPENDSVRAALEGREVEFAINVDPESEMLGSVRCGLKALPADSKHVLIVLGDQPGLSAGLIDLLISCAVAHPEKIISPSYRGKRGHPLLIPSLFYASVLSGFDQTGLRGLLRECAQSVLKLEINDPGILFDLDTPSDYDEAVRQTKDPATRLMRDSAD